MLRLGSSWCNTFRTSTLLHQLLNRNRLNSSSCKESGCVSTPMPVPARQQRFSCLLAAVRFAAYIWHSIEVLLSKRDTSFLSKWLAPQVIRSLFVVSAEPLAIRNGS